jgi:hypothetical protein
MDAFEIQVYDATADAQRAIGLELHVNAFIKGPKENPPPPQLPLNHQAHFTLEPSYGLFPWWEIGGYFQTAIAEGNFYYAGVKLRSKFVTPPSFSKNWRFGLNFEVGYLPQEFDPVQWGLEIRPIVAFENTHWEFAINPDVSMPLAGPDVSAGPDFEPGALAVYKFGERVSLGFEYYGSLGAFSKFADIGHQEHYIFEVANVLAIESFELNIGFGEGLTDASSRFIAKMIVGYTWEHFVKRPPTMR